MAYFRPDTLAWFVFGGIEAYASSWFAIFAEMGRGSSFVTVGNGGTWGRGTLEHPLPDYSTDFYGMYLKAGIRLYLPTND